VNAHVLQNLIQSITERMLNSIVPGMILAGAAWLLLRVVRRQNSAARFVIWFLALLAIVALPLFFGTGIAASGLTQLNRTNLRSEVILPAYWGMCLFVVWTAGAGLLLLRLGVGLWRVYRLRDDCRDVKPANLDPEVAVVFQKFAIRTRTRLCISNSMTAPAAIGFFRPAIVFPAWLLPRLSAAEIQVVLLHENAHLRRWDIWTNLVQKTVTALFFFQPAVWWINNHLTLQREMACDDIVLAQTACPRDYASFLISFAEKLQNARGLALAQALVSRMRQTSARVEQILNTKRPSSTGFWKPVVSVGSGLLVVIFGIFACTPQFVAFQHSPSRPQSKLEAKGAGTNESPMAVRSAGGMSRGVNVRMKQSTMLAPRARLIHAVFNSRTPAVPLRLSAARQSKPVVVRARVMESELPDQATFIVLQTAEYGSSGLGVLTLSIWRVEGESGNLAKQLESAIVLTI
jgi:beta-lactamase regulating signal transducer with metallopeptidase domain